MLKNGKAVSNLFSRRGSGVLPVTPVTLGSGIKTLKSLALCDSGVRLSSVDERLMKALNLMGLPVDMNVAGINATSDICTKRVRVKIGDQGGKVNEDIFADSHSNMDAGNRTKTLK